jgi:FdhE protein
MSEGFQSGPARDFAKVGEICAPPFAVLPNPAQAFARRAERLTTLAQGHALAPFLLFLSRLVEIQHQGVSEPAPRLDRASAERAIAHGMPALSKNILGADDDFSRMLDWFLRRAAVVEGPPAAGEALARVMAMAPAERLALAESAFEAAYPVEQIAEILYVAAGLQLYLTRLAAGLDASSLRPVGDGICPVCGGPPVASSIVGWTEAARARYCCCGLCATRWNYVRVKCVMCGSTEGVSQRLIEELSKDVVAEICDKCHGYAKQFREDRRPEIEPLADDIASFGLDLLVREQGYVRFNSNPFMIVVASSS